jgi:NNP family nitrate/nitrite transporter-like MFS transporter
LLLAVLVNRPTTPFWLMMVAAASAGLGGGNFASSMANISFFFPEREKGFALGLNAAGGNIGVSTVQLVVPLLIGVAVFGGGGGMHLENAGLFWIPLILLSAVCAWLFMNNLTTARASFKDQLVAVRRRQTWIMSGLYVGTFGSFVGFSAAFPMLLELEFPELDANLAFLGPLVGSLTRPLGGKLSDRLGGARVTFWNFVAMAAASLGALAALEQSSLFGCARVRRLRKLDKPRSATHGAKQRRCSALPPQSERSEATSSPRRSAHPSRAPGGRASPSHSFWCSTFSAS